MQPMIFTNCRILDTNARHGPPGDDVIDRFGEEYRQYQREVPQLLPRWHKAKSLSVPK
jgi:hypothetical protein